MTNTRVPYEEQRHKLLYSVNAKGHYNKNTNQKFLYNTAEFNSYLILTSLLHQIPCAYAVSRVGVVLKFSLLAGCGQTKGLESDHAMLLKNRFCF